MRFPRPRTHRVKLLSPVAALAALTLSAGVLVLAPAASASPFVATHLVETVDNATTVAGDTTQVTVQAEDDAGNLDTSVNSTLDLAAGDPQAVVNGGAATVDLVGGTVTFPVVFKTAGGQTISTTDAPDGWASNADVTIAPAAATTTVVSAPATVRENTSFTFTATATDPYGNTDTNYQATGNGVFYTTPGMTSSDPTTVDFVNGVATATADWDMPTRQQIDVVGPGGAGQTTMTVTPAATRLVETVDNATSVAGATTQVTVQAEDANGILDTTINSALTLTSNDPQAVINGGSPTADLVGGTVTFPVVFKTAGALTSVTANDAADGWVIGDAPVTVTPAAATTTVVSAPASVPAGVLFTVTATATDPYGNTDTSYQATGVEIDFTSPSGDGTNPTTVDFVDGVATADAIFDEPGTQGIEVAGPGGGFTNLVVNAVASHLVLSMSPTTAVAGQATTLTVTAEDANGNVATTDQDNVDLYDDANDAMIGGPDNFDTIGLVNGVASVSATFDFVEDQNVFAESDAGATGSLAVTVVAGPTAYLSFDSTPDSVTAGTPYTFGVYATDAYGNVSTMTDPVTVTWSANADPANPATASFNAGIASITGTYDTAGTGTINVTDSLDPTLTADASITVNPVPSSGPGTPPALDTPVTRVSGSDRFGTAAAISAKEFPNPDSAGAVVLARSDISADSTAGTVLAAAKHAPLLFTTGVALPGVTATEISRVLRTGGTVYVLGSTSAIPASVSTQLTDSGFVVVRLGGVDRYATSLAVAGAVGGTGPVFLATGTDFADALAAGPAAAAVHGVVLLTSGATLPASVHAYLAAHPGPVYAVGGQAAAADPSATPVVGADRYATAVAVAATFFTAPTTVGVASGTTFADALSGGAYLAHLGGPLLLTPTDQVATVTTAYLTSVDDSVANAIAFGGPSSVSASVAALLAAALGKATS